MFSSLYIHIPFCTHRCGYCDFNTYAGLQRLIPAYCQAVGEEVEYLARSSPENLTIDTIYFGGGTPSLLPANELENILMIIHKQVDVTPTAEITIEANPGTVSLVYLQELHALGINRISLGMQSANQDELTLLDRLHSFEDVVNAVEWARTSGINNLNLDLIFGLPYQTLDEWKKSLEAALTLQPEHLSLYALTLEHGTPLQHKIEAGELPELNDDLAADMYEVASDVLAEAGYTQYEISNWARERAPSELYSCRHNLQYWHNLPYIGVGAGAHGYINHIRTVDVLTPGRYIKRMNHRSNLIQEGQVFPQTPATINLIPIDTETEIGETMMMGLRLVNQGVSETEFQQRFGIRLEDRFEAQIIRLISVGLLEWSGKIDQRLRLTDKGRLLGNQVFREFI